MILFYSINRIDVNPLAHRLINEFGSFSNLLEASPYDIMKRGKVSENTAVLISMMIKVSQRYFTSKWNNEKIQLLETKDVGAYLIELYLGEINECFYVICLDNNSKLIKAELIIKGDVNGAHIDPKKLLQVCMSNNTANVILSHNHPSGKLNPSDDDIEATREIINMLRPINIKVLDHIIVGGSKYFSFIENKLM